MGVLLRQASVLFGISTADLTADSNTVGLCRARENSSWKGSSLAARSRKSGYAPVGMTVLWRGQVFLAEVLAGTTELSSRPERSVGTCGCFCRYSHPLKPDVFSINLRHGGSRALARESFFAACLGRGGARRHPAPPMVRGLARPAT